VENIRTGRRIRDSAEDRVMYLVFGTILLAFTVCVLYPCIYVVSASLSDSVAVTSGRVFLWPVDPTLDGYRAVFSHKLIMSSYRNTIVYTLVGTLLNVVLTILAAYPMSRHELPFRNVFMFVFVFTMFFSGGLVPSYLLISKLGLLNSAWVMMLPVFSVYNMILMRTNFQTMPDELFQAAQVDGCSYWRYLYMITVPLSKPVISVITLFYAVGHWNAYFQAMIYLSNRALFPLQLILRDILRAAQMMMSDLGAGEAEELAAKQGMAELLKYATIVASSAPIIAVYPFIQRYFVKGIMIGSLKG
jgi:putative aldouronate transport system permease protein